MEASRATSSRRRPATRRRVRRPVAVPLARLLIRHGRGDEAIEVMRTLADQPGGAEDWIVDTLCTLNPALGCLA
ncbi:hypothetical protein OHB41_00800 [Streptomyces sp. NBC_01571]|uniref:hypothetical protein n=1 Tax=Streptomyces sp. NBC_01571 TaxID=2975883 RepID=UPI0022501FA1|nr:hypothetical protein [Streptomyces sp. NBC_01571]MCX4571770.1 hypothetical protein [Streptomyces sp. NBC_01571]